MYQRQNDRHAADGYRTAPSHRNVGLRAAQTDFSSLRGSKVYLDPQYISVIDKDWIISSIRRTMAEQGLLLENSKDKAQVIVEVAFGAYGTDERDRKFGLPGFSIAPSLRSRSPHCRARTARRR